MTDKYNALIVVLKEDRRADDAESLMNAIQQMRGVLSVEGNVSDVDSLISQVRARSEVINKVLKGLELIKNDEA